MFRVGQKVVCVDAAGQLVQGAIYTVSGFVTGMMPGKLYIRTVELGDREHNGYYATRFRPIVERKTDISIFKAMLTPAGKKERVNAQS